MIFSKLSIEYLNQNTLPDMEAYGWVFFAVYVHPKTLPRVVKAITQLQGEEGAHSGFQRHLWGRPYIADDLVSENSMAFGFSPPNRDVRADDYAAAIRTIRKTPSPHDWAVSWAYQFPL